MKTSLWVSTPVVASTNGSSISASQNRSLPCVTLATHQSSSCTGYPSELATGSSQTWASSSARSCPRQTQDRTLSSRSRPGADHTRQRDPRAERCRSHQTKFGSRCVGAQPIISDATHYTELARTSLKNPAVSLSTHRFSSSSPFRLPSSSQLLFISPNRLSCSFSFSSSSSYAFCARGPTVVNGGIADRGGIPRGGESLVICDWNNRSRRADSARFRRRGVNGRWKAFTLGLSYR